MRKRREYAENSAYHVTSRTNDKIRVFESKLGQRIMLLVLGYAKEKYHFKLHNFSIMPNHFHLLITPANGTNISHIIQWIKTKSAKIWNNVHGSSDHLWGERFFSRPIRDFKDYYIVYNYINQNPVKAGITQNSFDWRASGAYYIVNNISGLVDFTSFDHLLCIKMLPEKVTVTYDNKPCIGC